MKKTKLPRATAKQAFILMELMIVIVIIGILSKENL
ncbi:MAG: prepilin-type N-terminal cleavage/methylation domain-containing protein [Pelagibacterales bacterium]|nr:prepilin-type N-terminal cleavage/methylation domain-containing protein [Pelagibacterales bacterium]